MEIELQNGMKVSVDNLIDSFGVSLKFLFKDEDGKLKYFYTKLSLLEAKKIALELSAKSLTDHRL